MRRTLSLIASLMLFGAIMAGPAAADDPPTLGATLTCDTAAGTLSVRSGEIVADDDSHASASGGPGMAVRSMARLVDHAFVCELSGHHLDVGVASYDGGHARGECGAWESGTYVIRMDRHELHGFGVGTCFEEAQHVVELRILRNRTQEDVPAGTDCVTVVEGMSSKVLSAEHCEDIHAEETRVAPPIPGFSITVHGNSNVCAAVATALRTPQPPSSNEGAASSVPKSRYRQIDDSKLFSDRHFLRWHTVIVGTDEKKALDPLDDGDDWAWTEVPYTNDGHKWLVRQQYGFARAWQVSPEILRTRDWSNPASYHDLAEPGIHRAGPCQMAGNPLDFPVMLISGTEKPNGRLCEYSDLLRFKRGQPEAGKDDELRGSADTIQFMMLAGTVYVLYQNDLSGVSPVRGTFDDEPVEQGGLGPASAAIRVVRFRGADYWDECLILTGALPRPGH